MINWIKNIYRQYLEFNKSLLNIKMVVPDHTLSTVMGEIARTYPRKIRVLFTDAIYRNALLGYPIEECIVKATSYMINVRRKPEGWNKLLDTLKKERDEKWGINEPNQ